MIHGKRRGVVAGGAGNILSVYMLIVLSNSSAVTIVLVLPPAWHEVHWVLTLIEPVYHAGDV